MTFLELARRFDDLVNAEPDLSADEAWKTLERLGAQAVDLLAETRLEVVSGYVPPTFNDAGDKPSTRQSRRWGWWRSLAAALALAFPSRVPGGWTLSAGTSTEHAPGVYSGKWPRERWRSFSRDFAAACRLLDEIHRTRQAEATANSYAAARLDPNDPYFQIAVKAATLADMYPTKRDELRGLAEQCDSKEGRELFGQDLKAASDVWDELERERKLLFALMAKHMPTEAKALRAISQGGRWSVNDKAVDITAAVGELRGVVVDARRQIGTLEPAHPKATPAMTGASSPTNAHAGWLTVTQTAKNTGLSQGEVSRKCDSGELVTNGLKQRKRRIDPASVAVLEQRLHAEGRVKIVPSSKAKTPMMRKLAQSLRNK